MNEFPIVFNQYEIHAALQGYKSEARRLIKPQPDIITKGNIPLTKKTIEVFKNNQIIEIGHPEGQPNSPFVKVHKCPFGKAGDQLWIKETWGICNDPQTHIVYKIRDAWMNSYADQKWKPATQMPREAARIILEIEEIKAARLQDITEGEAHIEGIHPWGLESDQRQNKWCRYTRKIDPQSPHGTSKAEFAAWWDSKYEKQGFGWFKNPWVWVIKFHVISPKEA